MFLLKNPSAIVLLVVAVLAGTALRATAINTEPIPRELAQFSFEDQESSVVWAKEVLELQ